MRKLSLQGPGRPACLLDSSAPLPQFVASHDWKEDGCPPTISLGALSFLLTLLTSLLPCSSPLRNREHHLFNFSGSAAAVKSFQEDSSSFTAVSFLSFSLSLSISLSLSLLSWSFPALLVVSPPVPSAFLGSQSNISVFVSIISLAASAARLSWSTPPPNPLRASGFFVFRFSHLLSASAYHRVRIFPFVN